LLDLLNLVGFRRKYPRDIWLEFWWREAASARRTCYFTELLQL